MNHRQFSTENSQNALEILQQRQLSLKQLTRFNRSLTSNIQKIFVHLDQPFSAIATAKEIYQHELEPIAKLLDQEDFYQYQLQDLPEIRHLSQKMHKFFEPAYDLKISQQRALLIYSICYMSYDNMTLEILEKILRIISVSYEARQTMLLAIQILQDKLQGQNQGTIMKILQQLDIINLFMSLIRKDMTEQRYMNHFIEIVRKIIMEFNYFSNKVNMNQRQKQQTIEALSVFLGPLCYLLEENGVPKRTKNLILQAFAQFGYIFQSIKFTTSQSQSFDSKVEIILNSSVQKVGKYLYESNVLPYILTTIEGLQQTDYHETRTIFEEPLFSIVAIIDTLKLMIQFISLEQFKCRVLPMCKKFIEFKRESFWQEFDQISKMIIMFIHCNKKTSNYLSWCIDIFLKNEFFQFVIDILREWIKTYSTQKFLKNSENPFLNSVNQSKIYWLLVLSFEIVQACQINTSSYNFDIRKQIFDGAKLLKLTRREDDFKVKVINSMIKRLEYRQGKNQHHWKYSDPQNYYEYVQYEI